MPTLKCLGQFNKFDLTGFTADKTLTFTGSSAWKDYATQQVMGTKVELTITKDDTPYKVKDGESVSNLYNKLIVKVPGKVDLRIGAEVEIVDGEATVYGEYRNQLSIKAKTVRPVTSSAANGGGRS